MLKRLHLVATMLAAGLAAATPAVAAEGPISVSDAWSRPGLPDRPAAGYLTIHHSGAEADRLTAAASPAFPEIELHLSRMQDGVMKMQRVTAIEIPPGGTVTLAPGGYHLMLFGAETPFAEGETFPLTLTFDGAGAIETSVSVERRAVGHSDHGSTDEGSMDHGGMGHGSPTGATTH